LRNVPHVAVVKYASHFQHGLDALQVYVAPLRLDVGGGGHDGFQLMIGQRIGGMLLADVDRAQAKPAAQHL
jgi:hypothetical protein